MTFLHRVLPTLLALAAVALGCSPAVPAPLAADIARTEPGKVTVIEFVDFQCPFCRMTHAALAPLVNVRREKVRVVRKQVPLRKHWHALSAARAAVCAEAQGKGDDMADALASVPVPQLAQEGCEDLAVELGLDIDRYRTCVTAPATDARIEQEGALFDAVGGHGLPLLFIAGERLRGAQDEATLERVLDEAIARAAR